jgi:hypothetical protein
MMELNLLKLEDLIAIYIKEKTGLENPLIELPMYFSSTLSDMAEWIDNYNNQQLLKQPS